jgi:hypothetical protein
MTWKNWSKRRGYPLLLRLHISLVDPLECGSINIGYKEAFTIQTWLHIFDIFTASGLSE